MTFFKKLMILLSCISIANSLNAQIKITTGGKTSIGYAGTPPTNTRTHLAGNTLFSQTSSGTGAMIRGYNGVTSASKPDYTWYTDSTTGIFHSASGLIQFTIAGGEKFRINSSGQLLNTNSSSVAATPDYSWSGDANTGMFNAGADIIGFSTGGTARFNISGYQLLSKYTSSSASTPDYSWDGDPNTGMYHPGTDLLGFVAGGSEKLRIKSNGQILSINPSASSGAPDYSWYSDDNTGMYNIGADIIGFSTGSSERMRINASGNIVIGASTGSGERTAIYGGTNQTTFASYSTQTNDYGFGLISYVNRALTKGFSLWYNGGEKFSVFGDGQLWSYGTNTYSDQTLKENIDTIDSALQKVLALNGVKYNYKAEAFNGNAMATTVLPATPPKRVMGLLAQQVEQVVPEVVSTNENGLKGIAYQNLVPLLIEAIKEQNKQITEQDAKINQLSNDLNNCCDAKTGGPGNRTINNGSIEKTTTPEQANWLAQNKPNPFNKETVIEYNVIQGGKGSVLIFDMNGKLLKTIPVKIPGKGSITINANDFIAGMYYYSLVVNDVEVDTKKMILTE